MNGKIVGGVILVSALIAGAALYYLQIYGFYTEIAETEGPDIRIVAQASQEPEPIDYAAFEAIDADSSPIRYRACFETSAVPTDLAQTFVALEGPRPRNAPHWFDCFDAAEIAAEIDAGRARAFLGEKNVHFGVDRIVAITEDGRGFVWHELNDCGEKAYDGTIVGEECPARE